MDGQQPRRDASGPAGVAEDAAVTEIEVLRLCALRIDGYLWASHQGMDREELLQPFWHEEARAQLMEQSWDHQWASWFMQERTLRWSGASPDAGVLRLWREFFLSLAAKRPSPPYDRGFGGDAQIPGEWEARFAPHGAELRNTVAARLARDVSCDLPLAGSVAAADAVRSSLSRTSD